MVFKIIYKILFILLICVFQNCSFYSFKGSIPSHIDSVVISPFKNETSEYIISDLLNKKCLRLLLLELEAKGSGGLRNRQPVRGNPWYRRDQKFDRRLLDQ